MREEKQVEKKEGKRTNLGRSSELSFLLALLLVGRNQPKHTGGKSSSEFSFLLGVLFLLLLLLLFDDFFNFFSLDSFSGSCLGLG